MNIYMVLCLLTIIILIVYAVCVQEGIIKLGEFHVKGKDSIKEITKGEEVIRKVSFEDGTTFELSEPITLDKERLYACGYSYAVKRIMEAINEGIKVNKVNGGEDLE